MDSFNQLKDILAHKSSIELRDIVARNSSINVPDEAWDILFGVAIENKCTVLDLLAELVIAEVARIKEIENRYAAMEAEEASRQMAIDAQIDQEMEDFVHEKGVMP